MRPDPRHEGRRWFDQAVQDLDDATFNRDGARYNVACFLSQLAAEKAVKAVLVRNGLETPWGHSVAELCGQAAAFDPPFADLLGVGGALDLFYIPTRYPNGLPGGLPSNAFSDEDADRALDKAAQVIEAARAALERSTGADAGSEPTA